MIIAHINKENPTQYQRFTIAVSGNYLTEAAATGLSANGEGKHLHMLSALQTLEVPLADLLANGTHLFYGKGDLMALP